MGMETARTWEFWPSGRLSSKIYLAALKVIVLESSFCEEWRTVSKFIQRTPRNYEGTKVTTHSMSDLLFVVLEKIGEVYQDRPDLILAAWPEVIGPQLASMTEAVSFVEGVLTVRVKNSTFHSVLIRNGKAMILQNLRGKFPKVTIKNIIFKIG